MPLKITVSRLPEIQHDFTATETPQLHQLPVEVFSQTFPEQDFDMIRFVHAINPKKRVRKARAGKDANA